MAKNVPADKFPWDSENVSALEGLQAGDDEPLVALLEETARPLHPELRRWLASMFKGNTEVRWWLKRHPGFQKTDDSALHARDICIGHYIHKRHHDGDTVTDAKSLAAKKFGLKARTIDDAWLEYRRMYFRAKDDDDNFAEELRPLRGRQRQSKGE